MADDFVFNRDCLVPISNMVNEEVVAGLAKRVAAAVPGGATIEVDERMGRSDWARHRVISNDPKAAYKEARTGRMARALGSI